MSEREQARTCRSKVRYPNEDQAVGMIKVFKRKMRPGSDTLRAYPCPTCGGWHMSSAPPLLRPYTPSPAMVAAQGGWS